MNTSRHLPALPCSEWKQTRQTLHLYTQIVGKIRMELTPFRNHWWHVPLYVTAEGLGTHSIPSVSGCFEIDFDLMHHRLKVTTNSGQLKAFDLTDGLSVSGFYNNLMAILDDFDIKTDILARPYKHFSDTPFADDKVHNRYDQDYVARYWMAMMWVDRVFRKFNSDFYGKASPAHLFWHSFDLATTRFSGELATALPQSDRVDQEAYSHELISFGFWPGDDNIPDAAFYSYTWPSPKDLTETPLMPAQARWMEMRGSPMALLMYEDVRKADDPEKDLLYFLNSAYLAGSELAHWDMVPLHKKIADVV
ncbi:MAG: DUF5996 family protein [Balneolales bacterium]